MAQTDLISAIDSALTALQSARKALIANAKQESKGASSGASKTSSKKQSQTPAPAKRAISEEGRQRIAEAQRKRWAASKKAAKKAAR